MAVQAVILKHAKNSEMDSRLSYVSMVEKSVRALLSQRVLVCDVRIRHVTVPEELAGKKLKIKFRMNGKTHGKSKAAGAVRCDDGSLQIDCNFAATAIFEGGKALSFDIFEKSFFGSSCMVAGCDVSLAQVIDFTEDLSNRIFKTFTLQLVSVGVPGKVLGNLEVQIGFCVSTLEASGGVTMLKFMTLPQIPNVNSPSDYIKALEFVRDVDKAQECLRSFFNSAAKQSMATSPCMEDDMDGKASKHSDDPSTSCGDGSTAPASFCKSPRTKCDADTFSCDEVGAFDIQATAQTAEF
jgi:hypothetical protein